MLVNTVQNIEFGFQARRDDLCLAAFGTLCKAVPTFHCTGCAVVS